MLRDFASFLRAVWQEWKVLLTGGSIIALLSLWAFVSQKPIARSIDWLVLGLTLMLATFVAWRKEWVRNGEGFIAVSPLELTRLVAGKTGVHADALLMPYLNKRIRVTGKLSDVVSFSGLPYTYVVLKLDQIDVRMSMLRWRAWPLLPIPRNTAITVVGRIARVAASSIELKNSEFVQVETREQSELTSGVD